MASVQSLFLSEFLHLFLPPIATLIGIYTALLILFLTSKINLDSLMTGRNFLVVVLYFLRVRKGSEKYYYSFAHVQYH